MEPAETRTIELSIVVAAWNDAALLEKCLASLARQTDRRGVEVIVAANYDCAFEAAEFPLKMLRLPDEAIVPELRAAGVEAACGRVVALVEDQCYADENWCAAVKRAHDEHDAVGGAVENAARRSALDWAVYFYDYGRYMTPLEPGASDVLSGMNASYKRAALDELADVWRAGFYEASVNEEFKRRGRGLYVEPRAVVYHQKNYRFGAAAAHAFHLARDYAARRVAGAPAVKRLFYALASCALPALLPARAAAAVRKKKRHGREFAESLPVLVVLMSIWAGGEFCGYLFGAGASARRWR